MDIFKFSALILLWHYLIYSQRPSVLSTHEQLSELPELLVCVSLKHLGHSSNAVNFEHTARYK